MTHICKATGKPCGWCRRGTCQERVEVEGHAEADS